MLGWRSQWRLVLLNSLTCGLEICAAAGITYVPPLLLEAGMEERYMTMVLGKDWLGHHTLCVVPLPHIAFCRSYSSLVSFLTDFIRRFTLVLVLLAQEMIASNVNIVI